MCVLIVATLSESHRRTLRGDRGRNKSSEWSLTWSSLAEGGGGACSGACFEGAASPAVIDGAGSCGERDNGGKFISPVSPCEPIILSQEWTPVPERILQSWPRRVEGEREGKSKGISMFRDQTQSTYTDFHRGAGLSEAHSLLEVFQDIPIIFCNYPNLCSRNSMRHHDITRQPQFPADDNWLWEGGLRDFCV